MAKGDAIMACDLRLEPDGGQQRGEDAVMVRCCGDGEERSYNCWRRSNISRTLVLFLSSHTGSFCIQSPRPKHPAQGKLVE
jgi:hypothetical protein